MAAAAVDGGDRSSDVLARLFGKDWHKQARTVELRALDGYVSRIDVGRFLNDTAFLAFARADGAPFTVDYLTAVPILQSSPGG